MKILGSEFEWNMECVRSSYSGIQGFYLSNWKDRGSITWGGETADGGVRVGKMIAVLDALSLRYQEP